MFLPDHDAEREAYEALPWERCSACLGSGAWESECCNGAGGCSCRGQIVQMGACNACGGRGEVPPGRQNARANADWLYSTGASFLGSGPNRGWSDSIRLGY